MSSILRFIALCLGLLAVGAVSLPAVAAGDNSGTIVLAQAAGQSAAPAAAPAPSPAPAAAAAPAPGGAKANKALTMGMFILIIAVTLGIVYWAASRTKTTADFYAARSSITGFQNGWAIAGDYMSAATFLGMAGLISLNGFDGFLYPTGWMVAFVTVLLIVAEPCRNAGKYTVGDVLSVRTAPKPVRATAAVVTLLISTFYLTAQLVGAGKLMELLIGIPYSVSILGVGILITIYVVFGGMIATTWVQIIKAVLLIAGGTVVALLAFAQFGFSFETLAAKAASVHKDGAKILAPGNLFADPVSAVSLALGMVFGTAGLPHILMRFFTVRDAHQARKSVFVATGLMGWFFLMIGVMGLSAVVIVGTDPQYFEGGKVGGKLIGGGNMPALHLAHAVGGSVLLGFMAAVAFATILAVVAGLALAGASAVSHDLYAGVIKRDKAAEADEVRVSKIASLALGVVAVILGIMFENHNLAFLTGLTLGIAASANFPVLLLAMYWKGLTTRGAVLGILVGLLSATVFVVLSKAVWVTVLGHPAPIFPHEQPALFSMPLAFLAAWLGSVLDTSARAAKERGAFEDQDVRAETGFQAAPAAAH